MSVQGGCEPYSMDFGDRDHAAWLERWLTPAELEERGRRWRAYRRVDPLLRWEFSHSLVRINAAFAVRRLLWPARWVLLRRVRAIEALAVERCGPAPGPAWKVRHKWGTS